MPNKPTYFPALPPLPKLPNPAQPLQNLIAAGEESVDHGQQLNQTLEDLKKVAEAFGKTGREFLRRKLPGQG